MEMATQNIKSFKNINSWDDFWGWYNRQLYYERMAEESVRGMNVTIGKKNYSLYDLEGISDGLDNTLGPKYWEKEFTEEQRREMWLGLGLSPSNYAYVQPYRQKALEVKRELFAMSSIQNERNKKTSEENKKDLEELKADSEKSDKDKMGQKEVAQMGVQATIRGVEVLEDMAAMQAKQMEAQGIKEALNAAPDSQPHLADWSNNGFEKF